MAEAFKKAAELPEFCEPKLLISNIEAIKEIRMEHFRWKISLGELIASVIRKLKIVKGI